MILAFMSVIFLGSVSASLGSPGEVRVQSSEGFFSDGGKVILFEWTGDSFDNSCVNVPSEEINSRISEGTVSEDVEICMSNKNTKAQFSLRDGGREDASPVNYKFNEWGWGESLIQAPGSQERLASYREWASNNCEDIDGKPGEGKVRYFGGWSTNGEDVTGQQGSDGASYFVRENEETWGLTLGADQACVSQYAEEMYQVAEIESTPQILMENTFSFNGEEKTISNKNPSITFSQGGEDVAKFRFQGGLETGWNFPQPDDEMVAFNNDQGAFIISRDSYSQYQSHLDNAETSRAEDLAWGRASESQLEQDSREEINSIFKQYDNSEFYTQFQNDDRKIEWNTNTEGGVVELDAENRETTSSSILVAVKADSVNYEIPEATPYIEDVSNPTIREGRNGFITAEVGNRQDATARGNFNVFLDACQSPLNAPDESVQVSPAPGETSTVQLQVSGLYGSLDQQSTQASCDVVVENLRNTDETVSQSSLVTVEQESECGDLSQGEETAQINQNGNWEILACSGAQLEQVKECQSGYKAVEVSPGDYECQENPQDEEKCGNDIDDDGDGLVDENCGGSGEQLRWISNQAETACVSNVYQNDNIPQNSFESKDSCESYYGFGDGGEVCIIDIERQVVPGYKVNYEAGCMSSGLYTVIQGIMAVLTAGVLGLAGMRKTADLEAQARNKKADPRSNVALAGGLVLALIGGAIGWTLGIWTIGAVILLAIIYGLVKAGLLYLDLQNPLT